MGLIGIAVDSPSTDSEDYLAAQRERRRRLTIAGVIATLLMGTVYLVANGNVVAPIAVIAFLSLVAIIWSRPQALLPLTLAGACLFETMPYNFADSVTDRVPFFWDTNTVFQVYAHSNTHTVPASIWELVLFVGLVSALLRGIYDKSFKLRGGVFLLPIGAYIAFVIWGILNGMASGGDFRMVLFEVRVQFYMLIGYLLAVNAEGDARQLMRSSLWLVAICIAFKGFLLTIRYLVTLGGHTVPELGVGAHEESFFFDAFVLLYFTLKLADTEPKLRRFMLFSLPFILIANLANERRAATGALIIAMPAVLALCYAAFPQRRRVTLGVVAALALMAAIYLPLFWNSTGTLGQPARAVKSQITPDERDQSSDAYRVAEDANLMATLRVNPILGYGYGKPFLISTQMVDLSDIDPFIRFLPHDQILWIWMRVGTVGFIVFWLMMASFIIRCSRTAADQRFDVDERALGVFGVVIVILILIFGLLDLQLSNVRDVLFTFIWMGIVAAVVRDASKRHLAEDEAESSRLAAEAAAAQRYPKGYAAARYRGPVLPEPVLGAEDTDTDDEEFDPEPESRAWPRAAAADRFDRRGE